MITHSVLLLNNVYAYFLSSARLVNEHDQLSYDYTILNDLYKRYMGAYSNLVSARIEERTSIKIYS